MVLKLLNLLLTRGPATQRALLTHLEVDAGSVERDVDAVGRRVVVWTQVVLHFLLVANYEVHDGA